jgi:hypothetical protein
MSQTIESVLERLEEPDTPVVWLDPSTQAEIWDQLPALLRARGYRVICVRDDPTPKDLNGLLGELWRLLPLPGEPSLESFRRVLLSAEEGWGDRLLIVFRSPDAMRQEDEAGFEAFVDAVEFAAESHAKGQGLILKLVLAG